MTEIFMTAKPGVCVRETQIDRMKERERAREREIELEREKERDGVFSQTAK